MTNDDKEFLEFARRNYYSRSETEREVADNINEALRDIFGPEYLEPNALIKRQAE